MEKPKGGRGISAPYQTKQMRVPISLESQIQELITRYRSWISKFSSAIAGTDNPPKLLDGTVDNFSEELQLLKSQLADANKRCQELEE